MKSVLIRMLPILAPVLILAGCNAVYFYETDKVSMTVETKPDISEPVAANLGLKQRVVLVLPADSRPTADSATQPAAADRNSDGTPKPDFYARRANEQSVSVISYFDLNKQPSTQPFDDPVDIDSTLITGDAARAVPSQRTGETMNAITGAAASAEPGDSVAAVAAIYNDISGPSGAFAADPQAKTLKARLDALSLFVPNLSTVSFYSQPQVTSTSASVVTFSLTRGPFPPTLPQNVALFIAVSDYQQNLSDSVKQLHWALQQIKAGNVVKLIPPATTPPTQSDIEQEYDRENAMLMNLNLEIRQAPVVQAALNFIRSKISG